jgi:CheY-like chemotaxis protein
MSLTSDRDKRVRLRVLLVEDEEADALLIAAALEGDGFAVDVVRVADPAGFRAAVSGRQWDVVISDHLMPGFGSVEAFEILPRSGLDLPFIVVSGRIGEEAVAAALRAGVTDYVSKEHLGGLGAAVRGALDAREQRLRAQAEAEEVARREARLAAIEAAAATSGGLPEVASFVRALPQVASVFAAALGVVVLFGWAIGSRLITSVASSLPTMKVNTALAFVPTGATLWLLGSPTGVRRGWAMGLLSSSRCLVC